MRPPTESSTVLLVATAGSTGTDRLIDLVRSILNRSTFKALSPFALSRSAGIVDRRRLWEAEIVAAQLELTFVIRGRELKRIPYGSELSRWRRATCGDCDVRKGQLHVVGCVEKLRGERADQHSIRINAQYRVCFRWTEE